MDIYFLQHIGIRLINEQFQTITDYDGNFARIFESFLVNKHIDKAGYPFLSSIDPYGNVFFNDIQVPKLINELKQLEKESKSIESTKDIDDSIKYLNTISDLLYIQFMGD